MSWTEQHHRIVVLRGVGLLVILDTKSWIGCVIVSLDVLDGISGGIFFYLKVVIRVQEMLAILWKANETGTIQVHSNR